MDILLVIFIRTPEYSTEKLADVWKLAFEAIHRSLPHYATESSVNLGHTPDNIISAFTSPKTPMSAWNQDEEHHNLIGIFCKTPPLPEPEIERLLMTLSQWLTQMPSGENALCRSVSCRAYQLYPCDGSEIPQRHNTADFVPKYTGILAAVCMTPSSDAEQSFNDWYAKEHIPMLSVVPGWISSRRYVLLGSVSAPSGTGENVPSVPKYLALHEWVDNGIFSTAEYKAAVNTPWRTEIMASLKERERMLLEYAGNMEVLANGAKNIEEKI